MKILHTADLHIGKKLYQRDRLDEQRQVLDEICDICVLEGVDALVASGDIFDTAVPSAAAEELFYSFVLRLSSAGIYAFILSGNHDDANRLCASAMMAKKHNIFLLGGYANEQFSTKNVVGGDGYIRFTKNGSTLNLALMPYPHHCAIAHLMQKDTPYSLLVQKRLAMCCSCFREEDINIIAAHLFIGDASYKKFISDERELGAAALLDKCVLPPADYVALGHIHKPLAVSKSRNIYYSGSPLSYSFDEKGNKSVNIVEININSATKKSVSVKRVELTKNKRLMSVQCTSFDEAMQILCSNEQALVNLVYCGDTPLKASEITSLKKQTAFVNLVNEYKEQKRTRSYKPRTDKELFCDFYKFASRTDNEPDEELIEMFLSVLTQGGQGE